MAQQVEQIKISGARQLTLNASTVETSDNFYRRAVAITIKTDGDVYIAFDTTATTSDPSIFLETNDTLSIKDCDFATAHVITAAGTATVRFTYEY